MYHIHLILPPTHYIQQIIHKEIYFIYVLIGGLITACYPVPLMDDGCLTDEIM